MDFRMLDIFEKVLKSCLRICRLYDSLIKYSCAFVTLCTVCCMKSTYISHGLTAILVFVKLHELPHGYFIVTLWYVHRDCITNISVNFQLYVIFVNQKTPFAWTIYCLPFFNTYKQCYHSWKYFSRS